MGKGKLFKAAATIAAIGGVCYVFRDKIKNSTVYQSLDMDDKVEKVKNTIKEKMPAKEEAERDYFSLDDADAPTGDQPEDSQTNETENSVSSSEDTTEEAATSTESVSDVTAKVDDLLSDIPSMPQETKQEEESPILYENEGLSDVSEDLDVIEEQDKLDL